LEKKKKEEFNKAGREEPKPIKKLQDYNFMPLSTRVAEVLMEITEDPEFHQPPKISSNPLPHNKYKYFKFHKVTGHHTEGCIALRFLIIKFIKNGK